MKYTSPPWKFVGFIGTAGQYRVNADSYGVASIDGAPGSIEGEANARLIAAAPDLLEALEKVLQITVENLQAPEMFDEIFAARAAIAKAKGET